MHVLHLSKLSLSVGRASLYVIQNGNPEIFEILIVTPTVCAHHFNGLPLVINNLVTKLQNESRFTTSVQYMDFVILTLSCLLFPHLHYAIIIP